MEILLAPFVAIFLVLAAVVFTGKLHEREMRQKRDAWDAAENARHRDALAAGIPFVRNVNPYRYH